MERQAYFYGFAFTVFSLIGSGQQIVPSESTAGINATSTASSNCSAVAIGQGAGLNGFLPFAASTNAWNQSVASASVDPNSAAIIAQLGTSVLHPDFGAGQYGGSTIGIPYAVVSGQAGVKINYTAYGNQSDQGPMPIPAGAEVEGYPAPGGDQHVLILNRDNCYLYELYGAAVQGDGSWNAASGAVWNLLAENQRPYGWTSADAAGLPVFPGLARYDEVAAGAIQHALRFTVSRSRAGYVAPATHSASSYTSTSYAPLGARLRLKASFNLSGFTPQAKVLLTALKTYGMILADNGSNLYLSGAPDDRWNNDDLHTLGNVPASAFEVVTMGTVITSANTPRGTAPSISSLTATQGATSASSTAVSAGSAVKLQWASTGGSYLVVYPSVGVTSGTTATVYPAATTTYTLYATNLYGQSTKTVTVLVK